VLQEEGFKTVLVFPQKTQRADIASETVIIACREMTDPQALMAGHTIHGCFAPYQVVSSKLTLNEVLQIVNQGCFYFSDDGLGLANDLGYFRAISAAIVEAKNLRPGTVEQLATGVKGVNLAIRTDVDMDLPAAAKMAKIAGGQGLPITFYLLHTAGYYGHFQGGVFSRNEANSQLYREMQTQGAEIALHIDPYSIYLDHGIDGAQAVKTELAWLRSCGLRIAGTSAHNAAPVYGAENFEIFKGRSIRQGGWFHRNYVYLPLGVLDEAELGLRYEACSARPAGEVHQLHDEHPYVARLPEGDFLRDYQWLRTYLLNNPYCRWAYTYHVWLVGKDLWAIAGRPENGPPLFLYPVGWSRVNDFLQGVGGNEKVLITLHPIYLGRRNRAGAEPEDLGALRSAA
jgi:peptidoglycan/xylan/chitin deacetylase (PgdA/CDA1 family)